MFKRIFPPFLVVLCTLGVFSGAAPAAEPVAPWWGLTVGARPTNLLSGERGEIVVTAQNRGNASTTGIVTIPMTVPAGLKVLGVAGRAGGAGGNERGPVACPSLEEIKKGALLTCTFGQYQNAKKEVIAESLPAFEEIEIRVSVEVQGAETDELASASVSGGGAATPVGASHRLQVDGSEKFGVEDFQVVPEKVGGSIDTQAGSHPFQLTILTNLNSQSNDAEGNPRTVALPKDLIGVAPAGLVGNPTPLAQCTDAQFAKVLSIGGSDINECPTQSAVGVATLSFNSNGVGFNTVEEPIFNMVPRAGEPARFGFKALGFIPIFLDTSVLTGKNYAVTLGSSNITEIDWLLSVKLTLWGVPGKEAHDGQRGWACLQQLEACPATKPIAPPPFLVMPTSCETPFTATLDSDSWNSSEHPAEVGEPVSYTLPEKLDGCNHLPFNPSIEVSPDVPDGSSPTGLTVGIHVPQTSALNADGLAESSLRNTTVALPEGVAINPAGADGLDACSDEMVGYLPGESAPPEELHFTPKLPSPLVQGVNFCPDASKIGTVKIKTPLLPNPLEGAVYLAEQNTNPFGSLVAMYAIAEDPVSGTLIKLPFNVGLSETGRVVATSDNSPQLPFETAEFHFFGGERAPLATPARCGGYTSDATMTPWSGGEPANVTSTFQISSGPNGGPCPGASLPFSPSLAAGTTSIQAGGLSPFTMTMSREDGQQNLQAISLHMPPGLSGLLSGVDLCPESQADEGLCGPNSQIGETTVSVGLGGDPFSVKGGRVYITGPYEGAPFGLSIVNPAKAGPFDLEKNTPCDCVLVRAKIEVDPITAQLTITSDNTGPYKIPTIIDGIPLEIKHVNVTINRPSFTFNPTDCNPMKITGSLSSTEGASSNVAVPLQVTNCAALAFKPQFSVSTSGKTSRANGASLHVKLSYPTGQFGTQANIARVKVDLPKQLPSELKTLQHACPHEVFEANPAGCSAESRVGYAKALTPLIPVPLEGPAYFVSYAGLQFPELIVVLQGYGVTIDLHGETYISAKTNVTSSTFATVPDQPIGSFELTLPEGKFSALAANGNLCTTKLVMPTEFRGQNGALIKQSTPIAVTGCKPSIRIVSHKASNSKITITANVPAAGKLTATSPGLKQATKTTGKTGPVALTLKLSRQDQTLLHNHPGRKLQTTIKLTFTPTHGARLTTSLNVNAG